MRIHGFAFERPTHADSFYQSCPDSMCMVIDNCICCGIKAHGPNSQPDLAQVYNCPNLPVGSAVFAADFSKGNKKTKNRSRPALTHSSGRWTRVPSKLLKTLYL